MADHCRVSIFWATCRKHRWKIILLHLVTHNVLENVVSGFLPSSLHVLAEKPPWNWTFNSNTLTDWGNSRDTHWQSPCQRHEPYNTQVPEGGLGPPWALVSHNAMHKKGAIHGCKTLKQSVDADETDSGTSQKTEHNYYIFGQNILHFRWIWSIDRISLSGILNYVDFLYVNCKNRIV